ncbi:class I adenylate-forming enzyme family protein [Rhodopseudomonas pseudopalustris]|uniref:3-methylmercaptopropionyl-CoA ligase n=1 Tax=Rhodopseudomonas pseudopalustris TaxID=1513892 RepID=A0A1H8Q8E3_9BRAD|nr:AMP-binding protein [Rhodopseudomonas pseudopalustris]MBB1094233.1 AMP-binding protein [Rhodopseudomonas palustris]SEO50499.1 long-chain acyl-CoA synthetase [Rhodopseudomonas pseudopalustris]
MNLAEWLAASARLRPGAPALLRGATIEADYATFSGRAAALAAALARDYNIAPGDRVALFATNCTQYLEALYGIWWAGAVAIPINAKLHGREAAWICSNAEAKLALICDDTAASLGEAVDDLPSGMSTLSLDSDEYHRARSGGGDKVPVAREDNDLAWLFYTSGTTGRPKGVMLSHGNLIAMSLCYLADVDAVSPDDAALYAAPISHGAGLYNFIHVRFGARHVVPDSGGFDPDEVLDLGKQLGNVAMFAAPTMVRRLVDAARRRGERGDGLRTIVYGGGPMYLADIRDAIDVMGQRFVQIYGQGESPMTITSLKRERHADVDHPRYLQRLASVGVAQSALSVRITGADGEVLPAGETGEIEAKGPTVMLGYWNNPDANAETLKNGWLRTGDVGRLDEDGFLTLSDRSKDVIISGGTNIYPREVEEALLTHPAVREVSAIGVADPEWGENVVACVVLAEGTVPDDAALDAHCLNAIARFKRPKRYVFLESLPKNNYGKVLKTELRKMVK